MLLGILGDSHVGCRNDSPIFHDANAKFYNDVFFPILKNRGITEIIQTGDLFDRRKYINFKSLSLSRNYLFDNLYKHKMHLTTFLGNHDIFHKNTLKINAPTLLLSSYVESGVLNIIDSPGSYWGMDFIPWIVDDNKEQIFEFIKKSTNQICFGHFELTGFEMDAGNPCLHGMDRSLLSAYDMVLSGHFHHRSNDGHIFYVGSPHEMTWADFDDPRGFHIFDTDTRQLEFIENPNKMFYMINYNDTDETLQSIDDKDYAEYKNKYVKVVVEKRNSHLLFDRFINNFYQAEPADLNIVEDFTDYSQVENLIDETVDQAQQTPVLLDKFVDAVEMPLKKDKMKGLMRELYMKAQMKETT